MPPRLELCKVGELSDGDVRRVAAGGLTLAVYNVDGEFFVTDDACTHGPGSLSEGFLEGDVIECNFHQGAFHIPTGRVEAPPCMVPLRTYAVQVVDGKVCIEAPASGS